MMWEQKETNAKGGGMNTQGPEHHPFVPSQYRRGGPTVIELRGCGLVVRGKRVYFWILAKASFGKNALLG